MEHLHQAWPVEGIWRLLALGGVVVGRCVRASRNWLVGRLWLHFTLPDRAQREIHHDRPVKSGQGPFYRSVTMSICTGNNSQRCIGGSGPPRSSSGRFRSPHRRDASSRHLFCRRESGWRLKHAKYSELSVGEGGLRCCLLRPERTGHD